MPPEVPQPPDGARRGDRTAQKRKEVYCSVCGKAGRCYDRLDLREFDFVPFWHIPVRFEYQMRRVNCSQCGVRVERVPWADGKAHTTKAFELFLAQWARKAPQALNILDRFHIVSHLTQAVNQVRVNEVRKLKDGGYDETVLQHTKYYFLKNPKNLTQKQQAKLDDVLEYDLKSVRAYLLKESFQLCWGYESPYWAEWYLNQWCNRAMRSRLDFGAMKC